MVLFNSIMYTMLIVLIYCNYYNDVLYLFFPCLMIPMDKIYLLYYFRSLQSIICLMIQYICVLRNCYP